MANDSNERHSKAHAPVLITDPDKLAAHEARNGLRQFDVTQAHIDEFLYTERPFKLRPSILLTLQRTALDGISGFAGNYRPAGIEIEGSDHQPVGAHLVPEYVEDMCDYVNDNWETYTAIHLAAYVMWRLNWIHPFDDGNGRTSRAVSYLVLCVKAGFQLPGSNTIPEQIASNKGPYYDALEAADKKYLNNGIIDLGELEAFLEGLLANQLVEIFNSAKGDAPGDSAHAPKFH